MKKIKLELTPEELKVLLNLASDQLFRREFIDPKMPGYRSNPEEMRLCKSLVGRLRSMADEGIHRETAPKKILTSDRGAKVMNGH